MLLVQEDRVVFVGRLDGSVGFLKVAEKRLPTKKAALITEEA